MQLLIVAHKQPPANNVEVLVYQNLDLTGLLWYVSLTATLYEPCAREIKVLLVSYICNRICKP